ncbi:hypothetical protein [Stigmatella hybrida]|uniref:hypothetical protein n=1 Tax=Stigmatella hybrida TaxID=394097 RepID=UPI001CDA592A|nr:hypothetical protein [Stigmatella hybrida]
MTVRARIMLLTEDSGKQGQPTVHKLLKEAFKVLVQGVDLNPRRIQIEPLPENDRARKAVRATDWKTQPPPREVPVLLEAIAARLLEPGFVIFHFDTDRVWSERHTSENRKKFESILRRGVRRILRGEVPLPIRPGPPPPQRTPDQIEAALGRLLVLSPCYSIESWLYQSTTKIRDHCQAKHASGEHGKLIDSWAADTRVLDEVYRPKDDALPCVRDHHNEQLAQAFPAQEVWLAQRSFYEFVETLRACAPLMNALSHEEAV